jgi:hypothetical protein
MCLPTVKDSSRARGRQTLALGTNAGVPRKTGIRSETVSRAARPYVQRRKRLTRTHSSARTHPVGCCAAASEPCATHTRARPTGFNPVRVQTGVRRCVAIRPTPFRTFFSVRLTRFRASLGPSDWWRGALGTRERSAGERDDWRGFLDLARTAGRPRAARPTRQRASGDASPASALPQTSEARPHRRGHLLRTNDAAGAGGAKGCARGSSSGLWIPACVSRIPVPDGARGGR